MEEYAKKLATEYKVNSYANKKNFPREIIKNDFNTISKAYRILSESVEKNVPISLAGEWLLDNYYIIEEQVGYIQNSLDIKTYKKLPAINGVSRISIICEAFVEYNDGYICKENIEKFFNAYQTKDVLIQAELYELDLYLQIALINKIKKVSDKIIKNQLQKFKVESLIERTIRKNRLENQKFYKGEMFPQLLKKNEVFNACWIGDINYFDGSHENDFVVVADSGLGASSKSEFAYGSSTFSLNSSNYTISYGVRYNGKVVGLLSDNISVSDYGTGVWIDTNKDDITVGSTKKIFYTVHEAFSNASIKFESTNEEVLVIKEINFDNKYLVVETLKKGTAGIKITVTDDRLIGTSYEETGLVNTDFEIDVVKAEKNVNTTKVMLWIAFGLLMVGLVYLAVKAIIDARKIDIK